MYSEYFEDENGEQITRDFSCLISHANLVVEGKGLLAPVQKSLAAILPLRYGFKYSS